MSCDLEKQKLPLSLWESSKAPPTIAATLPANPMSSAQDDKTDVLGAMDSRQYSMDDWKESINYDENAMRDYDKKELAIDLHAESENEAYSCDESDEGLPDIKDLSKLRFQAAITEALSEQFDLLRTQHNDALEQVHLLHSLTDY